MMATGKVIRLACQAATLFVFWLLLSGKYESKYLVFGLLSALLVTFLTQDLLKPGAVEHPRKGPGPVGRLVSGWRLFLYFFWLLYSIVEANLQVAYVVLHPKLPIQPGLLRFKTQLRSRAGHIILANSITLTPGTITADLEDGVYTVHALVPEAAAGLLEAKMQNKLEVIFGEREETAPDIRWIDDQGGFER